MYKNENKNIIYRERNKTKKCEREENQFVHIQLVKAQEKYVFRE